MIDGTTLGLFLVGNLALTLWNLRTVYLNHRALRRELEMSRDESWAMHHLVRISCELGLGIPVLEVRRGINGGREISMEMASARLFVNIEEESWLSGWHLVTGNPDNAVAGRLETLADELPAAIRSVMARANAGGA